MKHYINKFPWSMSAVDDIHRMYIRIRMDGSEVMSMMPAGRIEPEVFDMIKSVMCNDFNGRLEAQMLFYNVHIDDCELKWVRVDDFHTHEFTLTWNPSTKRPVYFYGGIAHGSLLAVRDLGQPYDFVMSPILSVDSWKRDTVEINIPKATYHLDGWDPEQRHWIFRERK